MKDKTPKELEALVRKLAQLKSIGLNVDEAQKELQQEIIKQTLEAIEVLKKKHGIT